MRRILVVQPSLQPPGGGNGVAAWVLQALMHPYDVTVLSWTPVDVEPINRFFGTDLKSEAFRNIVVPNWCRLLVDLLPVPAMLIRLSVLMRCARRLAPHFDVVFGVHNEADYGRRAIQYIHYPTYLRPRPKADLRWYHPPQPVLDLYYAFADRLAGFSLERMKHNVTLVNSDWTGEHVTRLLGIRTQTIYPPVVNPPPPRPPLERRQGFLAIGRISPEKEYERIMRILARVREQVPEVTLTIVGTWDRHSRRYFESLTTLAASLGPWIEFHSNLSREEVRRLMVSHRYGIHGMREEHFGMAPAEMARAGLIVWVPRGGGQMEIVANEPQLMYESDDDAVEKIVRTLRDEEQQRRLIAWLQHQSERFSEIRFMRSIRGIVEDFTG